MSLCGGGTEKFLPTRAALEDPQAPPIPKVLRVPLHVLRMLIEGENQALAVTDDITRPTIDLTPRSVRFDNKLLYFVVSSEQAVL